MNWKTQSIIQELLITLKDREYHYIISTNRKHAKTYLPLEKSVKSLQQRTSLEKWMGVILQINHKRRLNRGPVFNNNNNKEKKKKKKNNKKNKNKKVLFTDG